MTRVPRPALDAPASDWLVYGDALQEANDVRGELVGLSHGVDERRTEAGIRDAYVKRYATQLLGQAANELAHYTLRWKFSELSAVEVRIGPDDDGPARVRAILEAPTAELLTDITLVGVPDGDRGVDLSATMDLIAGAKRITALGLVDERARNARMLVSRDFDPDNNLVTLGRLAPFWDRLEHLRLDVADSQAVDLENINAPALRSFALRNLRFSDWEDAQTMCSRLGGARWPKLESLELRLVECWVANVPNEIEPYIPIYSAEDYDGRDDTDDGDAEGINWTRELVPVLATLKQAPLRRLALTSFQSTTSLLEALRGSGLLPVIKELDLSDSALDARDVDWMLEHRDAFEGLERLIVERTSIDAAGAEKLRTLGPAITHSVGTGAVYRYVVGQE
jgi:hypothetical protein